MKNKKQIFIVHGGMTFQNKKDYIHFLKTREISIETRKSWSDQFIKDKLGKDFDIIKPRMPLSENAKYKEWKINFERYIPFLQNNIILIGSSLGGIFLAKYLSEHEFPKKILSVYLVCPPFDGSKRKYIAGGFNLKSNLSLLEENTKNLYLLFSKDDDVVPVSHADKYRKKLKKANIIIYPSKNGHFMIVEFPEIIKMIKSDIKKNPTSK